MDIKELIERLKIHLQSYAAYNNPDLARVLEDAADALEKLQAELARVTAERDALIKRTAGECWACIRRYECNSRKGPHSRCWEFDPWLLKED